MPRALQAICGPHQIGEGRVSPSAAFAHHLPGPPHRLGELGLAPPDRLEAARPGVDRHLLADVRERFPLTGFDQQAKLAERKVGIQLHRLAHVPQFPFVKRGLDLVRGQVPVPGAVRLLAQPP